MLNMKKTLIACTVLTALAASAFAAEVQDNKPTMKERVNKILHENEQQPGHHKKQHRNFPRPRFTEAERAKFKEMTPEQRKAFMKQKHEEFRKNLTPEQRQRYDQHRKMMKERMEAHKKLVEEKMSKLTPEQKAEVQQFIKDDIAQRRAMGERLKKMTPEQREALRVARPGHKKGFRHPGPQGHGFQKGHHPQEGHRGPRC